MNSSKLLSLSLLLATLAIISNDIFAMRSACWSDDDDDTAIKICDSSDDSNWKLLKTIYGHTHVVAFNHDKTRLAYGSGDGTYEGPIVIWDISGDPEQWHELKKLYVIRDYEKGYISSLVFNRDATKLAFVIPGSGYSDDSIQIWNISNGELLKTLKPENQSHGHDEARVMSLAFTPDGKRLVAQVEEEGYGRTETYDISS